MIRNCIKLEHSTYDPTVVLVYVGDTYLAICRWSDLDESYHLITSRGDHAVTTYYELAHVIEYLEFVAWSYSDLRTAAVAEALKNTQATLWGRSFNVVDDPEEAAEWLLGQLEALGFEL